MKFLRDALATKAGATKGKSLGMPITFSMGSGSPTNDTDLADHPGDLYWDYTNEDLYQGKTVAAATTTWTKVID